LLASDDIYYLSEMMNFPGVLYNDPEVIKKISAAHKAGKPVDGHAPGLRGEDAKKYIAAGISTDH
ncbi:MAG TPA: adenine deaminase, partial [Chitinophagaceae bacterium]|nr:adenine deaminase [Chitinophagaceae bacterium]